MKGVVEYNTHETEGIESKIPCIKNIPTA